MPLTETSAAFVPSSRELLPRVLHDLAQPLSALACSLELALSTNAGDDRQQLPLEDALRITHGLSERLVFFRDLSEALQPCDCLRPLDACGATTAAIAEFRELAESVGCGIKASIHPTPVYGNTERFKFAIVRLLDWFFVRNSSGSIRLISGEKRFGEIRIVAPGLAKEMSAPPSLELVNAALSTMGAHVHIEPTGSDIDAAISFSSYNHPDAITSVLLGDF